MAAQQVNISVADDHLDRFSEVVERLEKAGLNVEQQMQGLGAVSGSIESDKLPDLERVRGVAAVEPERAFQIAPPDSEIQ